jgi:hypothetical protein
MICFEVWGREGAQVMALKTFDDECGVAERWERERLRPGLIREVSGFRQPAWEWASEKLDAEY